jgi:hypothetical protein
VDPLLWGVLVAVVLCGVIVIVFNDLNRRARRDIAAQLERDGLDDETPLTRQSPRN